MTRQERIADHKALLAVQEGLLSRMATYPIPSQRYAITARDAESNRRAIAALEQQKD